MNYNADGADYEYKRHFKEHTQQDLGSYGQYERYVNSEKNSRRSENGRRDTSKTSSLAEKLKKVHYQMHFLLWNW